MVKSCPRQPSPEVAWPIHGFSFVALSKNFIVKTKSTASCAVQSGERCTHTRTRPAERRAAGTRGAAVRQNGDDNNNVELAGISKKLTYGLDLSLQKL